MKSIKREEPKAKREDPTKKEEPKVKRKESKEKRENTKAKSRRVLLLCHQDLIPSVKSIDNEKADQMPWRTEYYVHEALKQLGYQIRICGLTDQLQPLKRALRSFQPHVVFNLLEEFCGEGLFENFVVDYLASQKIPVTGCHSEGLILAKNKLAAKSVLTQKCVPVPKGRKFPQIVKLIYEESSRGISGKSIVKNDSELKNRKVFLRKKFGSKVFSEEFIRGRELHVGVLSGGKVTPVWETTFGPKVRIPILSESLKWDFEKRDRLDVQLFRSNLARAKEQQIQQLVLKAYRALDLTGCARVDLRMNDNQQVFVIEVNPNPDLAKGDEFALCASSANVNYEQLIDLIVREALAKR